MELVEFSGGSGGGSGGGGGGDTSALSARVTAIETDYAKHADLAQLLPRARYFHFGSPVTVSGPDAANEIAIPCTPGFTDIQPGDLVWLNDQPTSSENGLWVYKGDGVPMVRSDQCPDGKVVKVGQPAFILGGTVYAFAAAGTVGAGNIFVQGSSNTVPTPATGGTDSGKSVVVNGSSFRLAFVVRKFASDYGDGASTSFTIPHGLATADLAVSVHDTATGELVVPDVTVDSTNLTISHVSAPGAGAYRVVAVG